MDKALLIPGLPADLIIAAYKKAPGNEIDSGKFKSPESSAALAANTFGYFLDKRPEALPLLPGLQEADWPPVEIPKLEATVRFPWAGGRHPCLDALIVTKSLLIGLESKRFEPFRTRDRKPLSEAYRRAVWGTDMKGYEACRDRLFSGDWGFERLDVAQLLKHAFGLRTAAHSKEHRGKRPVLFYLYAEPERWTDGVAIADTVRQQHRDEIESFSQLVAQDEVQFVACSYRQLLVGWAEHADTNIRAHAATIASRFAP